VAGEPIDADELATMKEDILAALPEATRAAVVQALASPQLPPELSASAAADAALSSLPASAQHATSQPGPATSQNAAGATTSVGAAPAAATAPGEGMQVVAEDAKVARLLAAARLGNNGVAAPASAQQRP